MKEQCSNLSLTWHAAYCKSYSLSLAGLQQGHQKDWWVQNMLGSTCQHCSRPAFKTVESAAVACWGISKTS